MREIPFPEFDLILVITPLPPQPHPGMLFRRGLDRDLEIPLPQSSSPLPLFLPTPHVMVVPETSNAPTSPDHECPLSLHSSPWHETPTARSGISETYSFGGRSVLLGTKL